MSLAGNLEDLGFGDILQIVNLSRKSGVLLVQQGSRKAKIIFRSGQLLAAFTNTERQDLARTLAAQGHAVDQHLVAGAHARHREQGGSEAITASLVAAGVPAEAVQEAARAEIEGVVLEIFGWKDGDFSFELKEIEEDLAKVRASAYRVIFESGINPQFLAMEGTRIADEARREPRPQAAAREPDTAVAQEKADHGSRVLPRRELTLDRTAVDHAPAEVHPGVVPAAPPEGRTPAVATPTSPASNARVVMVDDEERFLRLLAPSLTARGHRVEIFTDGESAAKRIEELGASGCLVGVVSDLLMPRTDGEGLLGGLELLERVRKRFPRLPFVLMTDHQHAEAEAKARLLDVDFTLTRPYGPQLQAGAEGTAFREFVDVLDPILQSFHQSAVAESAPPVKEARTAARGEEREADEVIDLGRALRPEIEAEAFEPGAEISNKHHSTPGLHILKSMLSELSNPGAGSEITLLILRFAAEVTNRAVLFLVKESEVRGLGQFGIEPGILGSDVRVRRIMIPLEEPSVFRDVVEKQSIMCGPLEATVWNEVLLDGLGGGEPVEAFVAPVIAGDEVVAVLYGDNLPEESPVGETEALEIFLTQAGFALEKAILERRLREMKGEGP